VGFKGGGRNLKGWTIIFWGRKSGVGYRGCWNVKRGDEGERKRRKELDLGGKYEAIYLIILDRKEKEAFRLVIPDA